LRTTGCIPEAHQRQRGISAHHGGRIGKHLQERLVKACAGRVLPHDPGVGVADFLDRIVRQADQVRIPLPGCQIRVGHAFPRLYERMLDVAGLLGVVEIFD
jgi:hypothetical protein